MSAKQLDDQLLPVIPTRGLVAFPGLTLNFEIGRELSVRALREALAGGRHVILLEQRDPELADPGLEDFYDVGVLLSVVQAVEQDGQLFRVTGDGLHKVRIKRLERLDRYLAAQTEELELQAVPEEERLEAEAYRRRLVQVYARLAKERGKQYMEVARLLRRTEDPHRAVDIAVANSQLKASNKQKSLAETGALARLHQALQWIWEEQKIAELDREIEHKVTSGFEQSQREAYLREQIHVMQEELGEDGEAEIEAMRQALLASRIPEEHKKKINKEIDRLSRLPENFPESGIQRNWLELLLELPFGLCDEEQLDTRKVQKSLDRDHFGLEKVKRRIVEYAAVRKLLLERGENILHGPILCLVGPPGVGKTSVAQAIAKAIGRRYVRMSLGGMRDEAEIRGHRRTYVGAMPGRIIQGIRHAGVDNPLFLLDEIDKIGSDFHGDPSSALLEVLDPEQNKSFQDHYLEYPYDLSKVLFITTANNPNDIPDPLRDRMELIEIPAYVLDEKITIAKRHLLPKQMKAHGIETKDLKIETQALKDLVNKYTLEGGVRQLEREICKLLRNVAIRLAEQPGQQQKIGSKEIAEIHGKAPYNFDLPETKALVGVVQGLAWTAYGGDTLPVEVNVVPGTGKLELTGKLGEVMQESAKAALSYIRKHREELGIDYDFARERDVHIHCPSGSISKDGPSAGVTLALALASALTETPISPRLAMTGEITLRGRVMPIGGVKEKLTAAHRAGVKTVLIPKENERDLADVPKRVLDALDVLLVSDMSEVLRVGLKSAETL